MRKQLAECDREREKVARLQLAACTLWKAHLTRREKSHVSSHPAVSPWTSSQCGEHFISEMARDQHARRKHGRRCTLSRKIGDTSTCASCMTDFRQRFRLVHHAREKRGKERGCRDFWLAQPDIDSDLADRLEEQDLTQLRVARKEGRSHAIACGPARRHDGKLIGVVTR